MTSKGVSFHPSPGGQFSAVVDSLLMAGGSVVGQAPAAGEHFPT
jgi:hypothetical protein